MKFWLKVLFLMGVEVLVLWVSGSFPEAWGVKGLAQGAIAGTAALAALLRQK